MCENCGCSDPQPDDAPTGASKHASDGHTHPHGASHPHGHPHPHGHDHDPAPRAAAATRTIELGDRILSRNDEAAARNRRWLAERGIVALNIISSPGSGKTFLLERTLDRLKGRLPCAVITGDVQTDNDARRLEGRGAPVRQIETHNACHLDAGRVGALLPEVTAGGVRLLFVENVGNLVCPAAFDLGESFKIALLSSTEGEDKPLKYPVIFSLAPVVLLTKMDLAPHLDWSVSRCREYLRRIHPGVFIFELSARTGDGMDAWIQYLETLVH